jgi:hypothetical protein
VLDLETAGLAMDAPEAFRAAGAEGRAVQAGRLPLDLGAYAVVRVDLPDPVP